MKELFQKLKKAILSHSLTLVFVFSSATVLLVSIASYWMVASITATSQENFSGRLLEAVKRLAALATAEELNSYRTPADAERPDWKALRQKLVEFAKDSTVRYALYLRVNGDMVQYIVDNDFNEATRVGIDTKPVELSSVNLASALRGETGVTKLGEYVRDWDGFCAAYAPIFNRDGSIAAICLVATGDRELLNAIKKGRALAILDVIVIIIVFGSGYFGLIQFRRETSSAKEANAAKTQFLARMSHEIRTPMNAVMGMSDLAIMNYGKPDGIEYIANIKQAGNNLLAIINGILDLSAVESGKLSIKKAPYKMAALLSDVFAIIKMRLDDKVGVELSLDIDPRIPAELIGDETRVKEIIMNLLSNAVKYTRKGFIKFTARGQNDRRGNVFLTFEVSDSGIGIKQEDMETIFADFTRIENKYTTGIQGTGLGLAITRALCRAMGGNVVVKSEYEKGSTFAATISQDVSDFSPMGAFIESSAPIDEKVVHADFFAPNFRVLIVDDILTNLKVAEGLLAPYQMQTDTCLSGREAIAMVQQKEYDLVLVDHMMPEMDGIETVAAIRSLGENFKKMSIVALTANVVGEMKEVFLNSGFNDFLSKPIEISKLKALLARMIPPERRVSTEVQATTKTGVQPEKQTKPDKQTAEAGKASAETPLGRIRLDQIDGLDTKKGIANTGGAPSAYRMVLEIYCHDARDRFGLLSAEFAESDIKNYVTNVHALKSASASIGASGLSKAAAELEAAGLRGDMEYIRSATAEFKDSLVRVTEQIEIALAEEKGVEPSSADKKTSIGNLDASVIPALAELKEALRKEDIGRTDRLLAELPLMHQGPEVGKLLSLITELVLTSEFQEAAKCIDDAIDASSDS